MVVEPMVGEPTTTTNSNIERDLEFQKDDVLKSHKEFPLYSKVLNLKDFKTYIVLFHFDYGVLIFNNKNNPIDLREKLDTIKINDDNNQIEVINVYDIIDKDNPKYIKLAEPKDASYSVGVPFREDHLLFTSKDDVDRLIDKYSEFIKNNLPADLIEADTYIDKIADSFHVMKV